MNSKIKETTITRTFGRKKHNTQPLILIGKHLLALLAARHALLALLARLVGRQLLLLLHLDLVAELVDALAVVLLLVQPRARALASHPVVTARRHVHGRHGQRRRAAEEEGQAVELRGPEEEEGAHGPPQARRGGV